MNIILLVIDTLRYDYIRFHGKNDWIQTPNLDHLASKSWVFDRCYISSYPTMSHRRDVITGQYGDPFNLWMPLGVNRVPAIPMSLAEKGYCTQLIHDTPHMANGGMGFDWPFHAWTFVRGAEVDRPWIGGPDPQLPLNWTRDPLFDALDDGIFNGEAFRFIPYVRANRNRRNDEDWTAAKLFRTATDFLKDNAERRSSKHAPFFLWLDSFDPHEPWDVPPEYARMYDKDPNYDGLIDPRALVEWKNEDLPPAAKERVAAWYAGKVTWVDRWFGEVLATLEETGLDRNTAIILTADHGTNLGERGIFGKDQVVREQEAHVPMIIHVPGQGSGRSSILVQPQDVFRSIMGIAGGNTPEAVQESYDILSLAKSGNESQRQLAVSGQAVHSWVKVKRPALFTVFGDEWYSLIALNPHDSQLYRYGSLIDEAADYPKVVAELREQGLRELVRRGGNPELLEWVQSQGKMAFPPIQQIEPKGWSSYWARNYKKW